MDRRRGEAFRVHPSPETHHGLGDQDVVKSVLEEWDFEPAAVEEKSFAATSAMPGTDEKLRVLAERVQSGLPLWHGQDRTEYDSEA
jgi:hypothetical protein